MEDFTDKSFKINISRGDRHITARNHNKTRILSNRYQKNLSGTGTKKPGRRDSSPMNGKYWDKSPDRRDIP
jgi:hypothetical protein